MRTGVNEIPVARYKLSPNEEAQLLKKERDKLRKQRLIAVRLQSKQFSKKVLNDVRKEKDKQLQILANEIQSNWEEEKKEKIHKLEELYERNLKHVGGAHVAAVEEDVDGKQELRQLVRQEDNRIQRERGQNALKKLQKDNKEKYLEQTWQLRARQKALEEEKQRAANVAAKPPIPVNPVDQMQLEKLKPVKFTDHDAFSTTHYHIPEEYGVVKEDKENQEDAKVNGELEGERYDEVESEKKRVEIEQKEKARLRYKAALEKERLDLDYGHILHELSDLQKEDRIRRQKIVSNLPKQIFVPPSQRIEELEENQRGMERAFEDMFIANTASSAVIKELILDSQPIPPSPSDELSISTLEEEPESQDTKQTESSQGDSTIRKLLDTTNKSDRGLRTLIDRIKSQRDTWVRKSNNESPAPTLTQYTASTGTKSDVSSLETGEVDSKSTVSTKTQSDLTLSTADEGTVTSSGTITDFRTQPSTSEENQTFENQTLLHPMEMAAKVRQIQGGTDDVKTYLSFERRQQEQIAQENQQIKEEAQQRRRQLEKQKQDLENKLRQLEMKRRELQNNGRPIMDPVKHNIPASSEVPAISVRPQQISYQQYSAPISSVTTNEPYQPIYGQQSYSPDQSQLTSSSHGLSGNNFNLARVKEYQEKLLKRQGDQNEKMRLAREDLQNRVDEMLHQAKQDYNSVPIEGAVHLPNFPQIGPLPEVSPLGYFQDVSPQFGGTITADPVNNRTTEHISEMQRLSLESIQNTPHPSDYQRYEIPLSNNVQDDTSYKPISCMAMSTLSSYQPQVLSGINTSGISSQGLSASYRPLVPNISLSEQTDQSETLKPPYMGSTGHSLSGRSEPSVSSYHSFGGVLYGQQATPIYQDNVQSHPVAMPQPYSESSADETGKSANFEDEFSASLAEKKNQLVDIQRRKEDILERQKKHEEELQSLKEKYKSDFMSVGEGGFQVGVNNDRQYYQPEVESVESNGKGSSLPSQPTTGWTYESTYPLKPELSTIIEVDSPEKTMMNTKMSVVGEQTGLSEGIITDLSEGIIADLSEGIITDLPYTSHNHDEVESMNRESPLLYTATNRPSSEFTPLDSQFDESSFKPLQSGIEISNNQTQLDSTCSSELSKPMSTSRNWHEVLAESSLSSNTASEHIRGIPVGQSEPVLTSYSQYRQHIDGEEQTQPMVTANNYNFTSLKEDPESTMVSSINDDLPKDRDAFLELREGSPSPEGYQGPLVKQKRPLSSTPARAGQPTPVNISQLRRPELISVNDNDRFDDKTLKRSLPESRYGFIGTTPSTILGGNNSVISGTTPSLTLTQQTLSDLTLKGSLSNGQLLSQYPSDLTQNTINSGMSSGHSLSQYQLGSKEGEDLTQHTLHSGISSKQSLTQDLTQYPYILKDGEDLSQHEISEKNISISNVPRTTASVIPKLTFSDSQSLLSQKLSSYLSELSQYPDPNFSEQSLSQQFTGTLASSELGGSKLSSEDPRSTVVRFAPGDPDVRFMSASSSEQGSQPYSFAATLPGYLGSSSAPATYTGSSSLSHVPSTLQENSFFQTAPAPQLQLSRPDTIGANNEELGNQITINTPVDELSKRIEETMRKHEKLLEESRRMSEKHDEEKQKYNFDRLEPLVFKELEESNTVTGITDEPDLTLISTTSDHVHHKLLSPPDQNSSLLSFELHEKSQATLSDSNHDIKYDDTTTSVLSFERHEKSQTASQEGVTSLDKISTDTSYRLRPGDENSSPVWLPLESDQEATQQSSVNSPSITPVPISYQNDLLSDVSGSTPTPTPEGSQAIWLKDEANFSPLKEEQLTVDSTPDTVFISIPVGRVEDESGNDSMEGLSLQEVFAKKKAGFMEKSKQRKEAAKSKIAQPSGSTSHMTKTMSNWKKSRGLGKASGSSGGKLQQPVSSTVKTAADRKKNLEEMKQRTNRLYNNLEDIKEKKQEDTRKKQYAANREKAKEYNRKLHESRLKKNAEMKKP